MIPHSDPHLVVLERERVFAEAEEMFVESAHQAMGERGIFTVALSGGSTPKKLYSMLAEEYTRLVEWEAIQVFFSDERCVPADHPDSNFKMVNDLLLLKVPIPPENVHRMKGEIDPQRAAAEYAFELMNGFRLQQGEFPVLDLVLLGMGEDGHTASIFPGSAAVRESEKLVLAHYVEKLEQHRLTLTPSVLKRARRAVFLVTGENKAESLRQVLKGPYDPDRFPAQLMRQSEGQVTWLVDNAAASLIAQTD